MTMKSRALKAIRSGYCSTSQDVADETGISVNQCSSYVSAFARKGIVRKTERRIPNGNADGRGRMFRVFEVVR